MLDTKKCRGCGESKPLLDYYAGKSKKDGRRASCKACDADVQRSWAVRNPEGVTRRDRRANLASFNLTFSDFEVLNALGYGTCWICKTPPGRRALDVDHVHGADPTVVRGLLCNSCNVGLGLLQSSRALLRTLIDYLENAKERPLAWYHIGEGRHQQPPRRIPESRRKRARRGTAPDGDKWCSACQTFVELSRFQKVSGSGKPYAYCRACRGDGGLNAPHSEGKGFKTKLRRKFDMTPREYDLLLLLQDDVCAGCGKADAQGERLAVDHDHTRGPTAVRGLLCRNCNIGMGAFKDDSALLLSASRYLEAAEGRGPHWWGESVPDPKMFGKHIKIPGESAVEQARIAFQKGEKTRWGIAKDFGISVQTAGEMLRGKTWRTTGGPIVTDPGEHTPGWSSREKGDTHWTRRVPERLPRGDEHHMRRNKVV